MGRFEKKPERSPVATTPKVEPRRPAIPLPSSSSHSPLPGEPQERFVSEEEVRHRAYELYLQRGGTPGDDVRDWLQAERELRAN